MASSPLHTSNHPPQRWDQLPNCFWQEARPDLDNHEEIYATLVLLRGCATGPQFMLVYLQVEDGPGPVLSRTTIVSAQPLDEANRHARLHVRLSPVVKALIFREFKAQRTIAVEDPRNPMPEIRHFNMCRKAAA